MRHIFIASLKWGKPRLTKVEVVKETKKLLKLGKETEILGGHHWVRQVHKEDDRYYDDPVEAVEYLIVEQGKEIQEQEIKLDDAHDNLELLNELLKEMQNPASENEVNER